MLNKLKENTNRQLNEIRKMMHEHNKNIYKQNRIYKKEQTFLELKKNNNRKISLEGANIRLDKAKEAENLSMKQVF